MRVRIIDVEASQSQAHRIGEQPYKVVITCKVGDAPDLVTAVVTLCKRLQEGE